MQPNEGESDEAYECRYQDALDWLTDECASIADEDLASIFYRMADLATSVG